MANLVSSPCTTRILCGCLAFAFPDVTHFYNRYVSFYVPSIAYEHSYLYLYGTFNRAIIPPPVPVYTRHQVLYEHSTAVGKFSCCSNTVCLYTYVAPIVLYQKFISGIIYYRL
jgi:hypothetical protein